MYPPDAESEGEKTMLVLLRLKSPLVNSSAAPYDSEAVATCLPHTHLAIGCLAMTSEPESCAVVKKCVAKQAVPGS